MNFKKLGNTDIKVSTICLGTMTWGEQNTQKEAFEQMNCALDYGINFFDAAEIYPSPCREKTYGEKRGRPEWYGLRCTTGTEKKRTCTRTKK